MVTFREGSFGQSIRHETVGPIDSTQAISYSYGVDGSVSMMDRSMRAIG